jgi:acetylornithine/succinyldiaminopimelate/putrescine aminotransferase
VLDGGLVSATDEVAVDGLNIAPTEQLNGCLAETIVLALEERAESFSLGRELDPARIREIGAIAARHGFEVAPPASDGRLVSPDRIAELRARRPAHPASRFAAHMNPGLADLYATFGMDRVFVAGRGSTLITADGTDYLDFVAGYGCLNLGHDHPYVRGAVRRFLDSGEPTFVQYTSIPARTAELAERLCELAPGALDRVFFSNSGAEAVEAALKLARAATGRTRLVYTDNSYHGKTFGALSVTGRSVHRGRFEPLVPDCVSVPYGDLAALRDAVAGAAAFVVEPVQGEGGVVLPPPGYLAEARRICRAAGAVFVLDEIQTGLGRTGTMFACQRDGVEPDVLCLAKSLSGGLVPIGATLATAEVWDGAYRSPTGSMLHTSTFGGGNLAAVAGLATLDVLRDEELPARAAQLGETLRGALAAACAPSGLVSEVRGVGLMNAIVFDGRFDGAAEALAEDLLTRLPGNPHALAAAMPDDVRSALRLAGGAVERALGDLLCLRFVTALCRDHRMLTFVTANSNRVVRIQPPLVLTDDEATRFAKAVAAVCDDLTDRLDP